jgi:hypothetical protein
MAAMPHLTDKRPKGHADNRWMIDSVLDQGHLGSCVWNMITQMIRGDARRTLPAGTILQLGSRLFGYFNTLILQGMGVVDMGCYPDVAMRAAKTFGICAESVWKYDTARFAETPPSLAYHDSFDQRGPYDDYWIVSSGVRKVDEVKIALDEGFLVGICGPVGPEYMHWKAGDAPLKPPANYNPYDPEYGGHARVLTHYDGDVIGEIGSWSEDFGDGGYVENDASLIEWPYTSTLLVLRKTPVVP